MFGGSQMQPQPPQPPPPPPPQPQSTDASTAEDEVLKSNTDCVYFLASPLTCKKGAECEYRHSEIARVNPRDCWYWLNGNCLNPKCAFRHPPLDGMLVPQVLTTPVSSLPPLPASATPFSTAHHNSGKQSVPCIFFQKGFCLKGDKCPFLHGPVLVNSKAAQGPVAASFSEPSTIKKPVGGFEKCSVEPKDQEVNIPKATRVPLPAKPLSQGETTAAKDLSTIEGHVIHPFASAPDDYPAKFRQMTPPVANGDSISRPIHEPPVHLSDNHDTLNSKDADEFSREPSPGFDVLVDDELRDTDYYHDEDHYERTRANEERNLNPVNDYDISHSVDYNSMVDVDRDAYRDPRRYDSFDQMRGRQYGRDQPRDISERISGGPERRRNSRDDSSDHIDGFDLRYHLSKHRKVNNGMRSVLSHDLEDNHHGGDRSYRGSSRRDPHHLPASGGAFSNRLHGRIKLPDRSMSPYNGRDLLRERELERRNNFGHQGRLQHRLKGRVHEDFNNEGRGLRGPQMGDRSYDSTADFAGPKSLAELRGRKTTDNGKQPTNDSQQVPPPRKRKYSESHQQSECELSFEGPKPLSEILKRKRAADGNGENLKWKEDRENLKGVSEFGAGISSVVPKEEREDFNSIDGQRNKGHMEEGLVVGDDAMEDQEPEAYAEEDEEGDGGEPEYEQVEGEEYYNEDRADLAEAEFVEDDDGDDFAKKIGVMFS